MPLPGNLRLLPLGPARGGSHSEWGPWAASTLAPSPAVSYAHSGVILGVSVSHYLLETSRVVFQVRPTLLLTSQSRKGKREEPL